MELNIHDIEATGDVFDDVAEASDSLTIEEAVAVYQAVGAVIAKAKAALGLVEMHLQHQLESPRQMGGKVYYRRPAGKWTPDQEKLKGKIVEKVINDADSGVICDGGTDAVGAVQQTVDLLYALFVAPGSMPKEGGLKKLGLTKGDIASYETTGHKIVVDDLEGEG